MAESVARLFWSIVEWLGLELALVRLEVDLFIHDVMVAVRAKQDAERAWRAAGQGG